MSDSLQPDRDTQQQNWHQTWGEGKIVLLIISLASGLTTAFVLCMAALGGLMAGDIPNSHVWPYTWDSEALSHLANPYVVVPGSIFLLTLALSLVAALLSKHAPRR